MGGDIFRLAQIIFGWKSRNASGVQEDLSGVCLVLFATSLCPSTANGGGAWVRLTTTPTSSPPVGSNGAYQTSGEARP